MPGREKTGVGPESSGQRIKPPISLSGTQDADMVEQLCSTVSTSLTLLNSSLQEFFSLKSELLQHSLPPNLLLRITITATRIFRSYSDLHTPVSELTRLARHYSTSWEEKGAGLQKLRDDYEKKQRQLNIALRRIQMMAVEKERMDKERNIMNWQRLYTEVMAAKSQGRRWKFRIESLRKKVAEGNFNPYAISSPEESEEEDDDLRQLSESQEDDLRQLSLGTYDGEGERLPGIRSHDFSKAGQFAGMDGLFAVAAAPSPVATPPAPPTVETADVSTWTQDPEYDNFLLLRVFRPTGILSDQPLCCTLSLGGQFLCTEPFPPDSKTSLQPQTLRLSLPDEVTCYLPPSPLPPLPSRPPPCLSLAVYPRSIAEEIVCHASLPLPHLHMREPTVLAPPPDSDGAWQGVDWDSVQAHVQDSTPDQYRLRRPGTERHRDKEGADRIEEEEEEEEEEDRPTIRLVCHRVKIMRHSHFDTSTSTEPLDDIITAMGYKQLPELISRAVSPMLCEATPTPNMEAGEEKEERISLEEVMKLTLKHTEEMTQLQEEYEKRLESLASTLARIKTERTREVHLLQQALQEAEQNKGMDYHSTRPVRSIALQKKTSSSLPHWRKDLPQNFFERLELFAVESIRKHNELTTRIRKEVREACEKQLSTQFRLAPTTPRAIDTTLDDVSLPALFMPSPLSKPHIFTPRARTYFHPPGATDEPRLTQPPAIFKIPALHRHSLSTLNLFELSQHFSQSGPHWSRPSPDHTPAPPPSSCGHRTPTFD